MIWGKGMLGVEGRGKRHRIQRKELSSRRNVPEADPLCGGCGRFNVQLISKVVNYCPDKQSLLRTFAFPNPKSPQLQTLNPLSPKTL